jgi:hypothetical protein
MFFALLFIAAVSCNGQKKEQFNFSKKEAFPIHKLSNDLFYSFVHQDSVHYKIVWGHKLVDTLTSDTTFIVLGSGDLGYLTSNKDAIILEQECGTECNYLVVLPLTNKKKLKVYYNSIAIDSSNNLIAYVPEDRSNFVSIESIITQKKIDIREETCDAAAKIDCIDSAFFDNNNFYLKWFVGKDTKVTRTKKYSLSQIISQ